MTARLNVGCGRNRLEGWTNLDIDPENSDVTADVQEFSGLPFPDDSFDEILMSHLFEHLTRPLQAMYNLWRVAKPGAQMIVRCPWGGSHVAFEDPTHVRQVFLQTMHYYSQTAYNAADYGYRGDWETRRIIVVLNPQAVPREAPLEEVHYRLLHEWNIGIEIICEMCAVKPAREPGTRGAGFQLQFAYPSDLQPEPPRVQ